MLRMLLMRRLCRGILPMGLLEYLGMWPAHFARSAVEVGILTRLGTLTGSCSCIRPGCLRRAFLCLGRLGRV